RLACLALEPLEPRVVPSDLTVPLDPALDRQGTLIPTIQSYEDLGRTTLGFFDTAASAITFSPLAEQSFEVGLNQDVPEDQGVGIPVKVPDGVRVAGLGGPFVSNVSQPGTIRVDGLHNLTVSFDEVGLGWFHYA